MVISGDLYHLIKSMRKQEKIYFKRFSGLHVKGEENNYIRLFDAIAEMKEYDEEKLVKKFKRERFTRQMGVAKNYLYSAILRAMRVYRQPAGKKNEISKFMEDVGFLFDKRLYAQCRKILRRSRKTAEAYEKFPEMIEILIWESKINYAEDITKRYEEKVINKNYDERKRVLEIMNNMYEYDRLEYNFRTLTSSTKDKTDPVYKKKVAEYIKNPILGSEELALSTVAKLKYNAVKSNYYYETGDYDVSFGYEEKQLELMDSKPGIKGERFNDYLVQMNNLMLLSIVLKKFDRFKKYLKKFREQAKENAALHSKNYRAYIIERSYMMEMFYSNKVKEFGRTVEMYELLNDELRKTDVALREGAVVNVKYLIVRGIFWDG